MPSIDVNIPTNEDIPIDIIADVRNTLNKFDFIDWSASSKR
jgi:hypothetical protein